MNAFHIICIQPKTTHCLKRLISYNVEEFCINIHNCSCCSIVSLPPISGCNTILFQCEVLKTEIQKGYNRRYMGQYENDGIHLKNPMKIIITPILSLIGQIRTHLLFMSIYFMPSSLQHNHLSFNSSYTSILGRGRAETALIWMFVRSSLLR